MKNIKQNNLSLKSLKAELEQLKNNTKTTQASQSTVSSQTVSTDARGKQNILTRFYRAGSLPMLWLITMLLTYAHKIPIVSKLIKLLSLWYGRTTWWQLLIKLRKLFVVYIAL